MVVFKLQACGAMYSRSNWNVEVLVFLQKEKKLENPDKKPRSKDEKQQPTTSTYDNGSGNKTWTTLRWEARDLTTDETKKEARVVKD